MTSKIPTLFFLQNDVHNEQNLKLNNALINILLSKRET